MRISLIFSTLLASLLVSASLRAEQYTQWEELERAVRVLIQQNQKQEAFNLLLSQEVRFSGQAEFDYQLGVFALENNDLTMAELALERVVLVNPAHVGAWMDLAIVYYRREQYETALQTVLHLEQNFNLNSSLLNQISAIKRNITLKISILKWSGFVGAYYGYTQNANYGLNTGSFMLTPVQGAPIEVQVDKNSQPKSDHAFLTRASLFKSFPKQNGGEVIVSGSAYAKSYIQQTDYSLIDVLASVTSVDPIQQFNLKRTSNLQLRHVHLGQSSLANFVNLNFGVVKPYSQCEIGAKFEYERRFFMMSGVADSYIPWIGGVAYCQNGDSRYGISARYGVDFAQGLRAGGDTERVEGNVYWLTSYKNRIRVNTILFYADYQDRSGFSQLIKNNDKREIRRLGGRVELMYRLVENSNLMLEAILERSQDNSNIPVSRLQDWQAFTGVRYEF